MIAMRDDIRRDMKRGEVTMVVLADCSKALDTIAFVTILRKIHQQGFSTSYLNWITNYLTGRKQIDVQIDDRASHQYFELFFLKCTSTTCQIIWDTSLRTSMLTILYHLHAQQACRYYGMRRDSVVSS